MNRAVLALKIIRNKIRDQKVAHVRCIATEACRQAKNGRAFVERIAAETGLTFKIISAEEEARLATLGCHDLIGEDTARALVVDIGGGSTELSWIDASAALKIGLPGFVQRPPILAWSSIKTGVVTLHDQFKHLPQVEAYGAMLAHARDAFGRWPKAAAIRDVILSEPAHLIGTSGTVTCLAGVHLGLKQYKRNLVDGAWLSREESEAVIARVAGLDLEGRAALPTIGPERAPLMPAGCAILQAVWEAFPAPRIRIGDRGLREGLLNTMMHPKQKSQSNRRRRSLEKATSSQASAPT
jgi:exopolyphosphatase / guanosine-5'-triphosphate,3'-diphosphate pyrophosphatase